jgi:hypothetical protein
LLFLIHTINTAQTPIGNPKWQNGYWEARWIHPPDISPKVYGVHHFRKSFSLEAIPDKFIIHISADNRYRLFINGKPIGMGPARSDTQHWFYESYDIKPYLNQSKNTLAVLVWNMGEHALVAQMSYQTGLIVQGDGATEKTVNTNDSWKVYTNAAYKPIANDIKKLQSYIVIGAGDEVDGALYPWSWELPDYDDIVWKKATVYWFPSKTRGYGTDGNWMLMPRNIPFMEEKKLALNNIRRIEGMPPLSYFDEKQPLNIEKNKKVSILFDQTHLTNAYPELIVSGGKGARMKLTYAEGLKDNKKQKGNRNDIDGKKIIGFEDVFIADGGQNRIFRPLWFRTYRYLQLDIETADDPLIINNLYGIYYGYPFEEKAVFTSDDATLKPIWEVGWRTARLCAGENYYDCPYYEQLQYTGDTRIQALISLYVAGDDRLMRKAITDYDNSRFTDGLTQSRYPCNDMQVIPTFSLFWVAMIYDYWMHRQDDSFIEPLLKGVDDVIIWHENRLQANGMNGKLEWWNFVDWSWGRSEETSMGGVPAGAVYGNSSILSLQLAYTLQLASKLMQHYGQPDKAKKYQSLAAKITQATYNLCFDKTKGLLSDTPDKKLFSQHANIWGVLTDAIPQNDQRSVLEKTITDKSITQATFYFKFYLFEALKKTGMGDRFLEQLKPWHDMIQIGLTTFAEKPEPTRSDCHAWSASPNYQLLSTVCGINPAEPGFKSVIITPYLSHLSKITGKMPHPLGEIAVNLEKTEGGILKGDITLPKGLKGQLVWMGKTVVLKDGSQKVQVLK